MSPPGREPVVPVARATKGAPRLGVFAAIPREELGDTTEGGLPNAHRELRALGYLGVSELLSYGRA